MINNWWVTRPKRKLFLVPETVAVLAQCALDCEWHGKRATHRDFEVALEKAGIKQVGTRRDQSGGGGRTYVSWLKSLGLVFSHEVTKQLKLTLAGEAIMAGDSPVAVLKHQILRYQFPSSYSLSKSVRVNERFKIRPFRFLLRLLADDRIQYLTKEEIGKIVIVEAENEEERCYQHIVERVLAYRQDGDSSLIHDFAQKYPSSKGISEKGPFENLLDVANTIQIWIEYTQLAKRDNERKLRLIPEKIDEIRSILSKNPPLINRPESHEYFQRKYGVDPKHKKDTRNLIGSRNVTEHLVIEHKIKEAFVRASLHAPIAKIDTAIIDKIAESTGIRISVIEETLHRFYPHGAIGSFMPEYCEMAFRGRNKATEFEQATAELFKNVFGFETRHVGSLGRTPDVLLLSDENGYCGIIDNKASSKYTISNDHRNRMITNYIGGLHKYYKGNLPLAFFSYIAGGFGTNIDDQIADIVCTTSVHGSAINIYNIIKLVEKHSESAYSHSTLRDIFSLDRQVLMNDL